MQEKAKEPEIRFAGFTGAWEQRKLNEIADVYDGVHQTPKYTSSGVRFLSVENIATLESEKYISEADFIRDFKIFPQKGDILMTRIGDIGTAKVIKSDEKYAFYVSLALLKPKHINSDFLCNSIASKNFQKGLKARSLLTAIPLKINKEEIGKVATSFPLNLSEQEKIGSFFNHIESLLTLHQRKYEKLLNIKKSMLEKMFPKEGEVVPEIRFKGFTGAWEQRKFSELYKRSSEKNDGSMGVDRFITVATMQFKSDIRVTEDEYLKTYFTFKLGDIAFEGNRSKNFKYGRFVENDIGDGLVSHVFIVMRPITNYDLYFWKYAIHNENLMRKILQRSTKSSTMMHDLVVQDFLNEKFSVPSLKEQKAIGNFLRTIDSLLTLHQRKLEMLKNVKQAFLEKMFV